jgi:hypothetical protein
MMMLRLKHCSSGRANEIDLAGWNAVADALKEAKSIASLNGVDDCAKLFAGDQHIVNLARKSLHEKEAVIIVARLLERSAKTLKTLDLRYWSSCAPALLLMSWKEVQRACAPTGIVMLSYDAPFSSPKSFSLSLRKRENQCNI